MARRDELGRLFDLSRDVLLITDSHEANASLASFISRRFDLDYVAICVPRGGEWIFFEAKSQESDARLSANCRGRLPPPLMAQTDGRRR